MGKFNTSLMEKVEKEEKKEQKQKDLKARAGIDDDVFYVKEKGVKDYLFSGVHIVLSIVIAVLTFVGVATLLNPESRLILLEMLPFL